MRLGAFVERVADRTPAPGGGSVAAVVAALAAALTAMAARFASSQLGESTAADVAERAHALAVRAGELADADAAAYADVLSAAAGEQRRDALLRACDVPAEVARIGDEVQALARRLVAGGNPNLRGDAETAAFLAGAAAVAAGRLVALNEAAAAGMPRGDG
jgi:formiminotetrahydrofolate cyclodeaminase